MVALTKRAVLIQRGNPVGFNERANQIFPMRGGCDFDVDAPTIAPRCAVTPLALSIARRRR